MDDIKNLLYVSDRLSCAGQPDHSQLSKIAADGFEVVINLGLSDGKYALPDEAASVTGLGLAYYHIPVLFESPQPEDLLSFIKVMRQHHDEKKLVHCAVNYRASAFTGLYLFAISQLTEDELHSFIAQIWNPNPVWQQFIEEACLQLRASPHQ
jgi:protein tyrosine phosphatase (PTP) superfamily phosphohydrolase (DUF442 family)